MSKGDYNEPKTLQGSLVAHQPLELLCIDFTKVDVAKGGKENVLVLMDTFSKYSQAFIMSNQKALTVAKLLVDKWFSVYSFMILISLYLLLHLMISNPEMMVTQFYLVFLQVSHKDHTTHSFLIHILLIITSLTLILSSKQPLLVGRWWWNHKLHTYKVI